ncbi:hypothetical protein CYMTET_54026 [Cymbomonas tetramitiformis]|uniref:Uncharacterized protein n=1 Tax=Cymbomonas tetramitiformis TaxID=36881 RepID=A0AAE0EPF8_9CHLO|nr:hypothetical protein CYMTET_54026 [Cymbomonas tetramitiformis]
MSSSRRASSLYVPPQRRSGVAGAASGPSGLSSSARVFEHRGLGELGALEPTPYFVPEWEAPAGARRGSRGGGAVQRSLEGEYALLASAPLPQEESRTQASLPATPTNFPDGSRDSPGLVSATVRMFECYSTPQQRAGGAEITLEITACNIARSEFYVRKCMKAWKATVDFASKCTTFAVQREQHVKREVLHEWSALTDTPDVTPKQWATLRRHLRRLCGQEDSIAAITWEALTELAHKKEVAKQERKRQKLAKRKLAKARRRSDEGKLMYDSTSTSSEEKSTLSSCQTSSTEALSSDASHTSSSRSSRQKGGRQRRRQAQATRHERQLRELQEESERVALDAATAHQAQLTALRMDMHNAVEEATRMQQELRTKVCQEARQAALESAEEQIARMQHAADAVSHQHEQAVASQAEEAARHHQQLREMQRAAEEQRQQLDQAARDQRLLEQQVAESKMVVQAALEAADGRAHSRPGQPPNTPASYATVTSDAQEAEHEALMVPPSATTVDVRGHKGVTFEEDASTRASSPTSVHDRLAKVDWRSISAPAAVAIRARVEERLGGHAGNLEAERMFFDVARKYRDHDLASGSGPPISEAPASQLPRPPHLGTAVIQSVHDEVASSRPPTSHAQDVLAARNLR